MKELEFFKINDNNIYNKIKAKKEQYHYQKIFDRKNIITNQ